MSSSITVDPLVSALIAGNRPACREFITARLAEAADPVEIYHEVLWPAMEQIDKLYRADRINIAAEHLATRMLRCVADQMQTHLKPQPSIGKKILISCADSEPEEIGAQMCADLFEARGWEVYFLGGGVPNDEILSLVGQLRPEILLIFGTQPAGVPGVRQLTDLVREVASNPTMNIMVSGGVFNRADSLWKEINADIFAKTAHEAIPLAEAAKPRDPIIKIAGAPKKRRRRRRPPLLVTEKAEA